MEDLESLMAELEQLAGRYGNLGVDIGFWAPASGTELATDVAEELDERCPDCPDGTRCHWTSREGWHCC